MPELSVPLTQAELKRKTGVYVIINVLTGKRYFGSSVSIGKRWKEHKKHLRLGIHHSKHLQASWDKYGERNFIFRIVEECVAEELLIREQGYIDVYETYKGDRGYNCSPTAGSMLGMKFSDEVNAKKGTKGNQHALGMKHSETTKQHLSSVLTGKPHNVSEEGKAAIREAAKKRRGRKMSDEVKAKISVRIKGAGNPFYGKKHSEETKEKIRQTKLRQRQEKLARGEL